MSWCPDVATRPGAGGWSWIIKQIFMKILLWYKVPMEIVMIFLFQNDIFRTSKEYFWLSYTKSSNQNSGTEIETFILFTSSITEGVNVEKWNFEIDQFYYTFFSLNLWRGRVKTILLDSITIVRLTLFPSCTSLEPWDTYLKIKR